MSISKKIRFEVFKRDRFICQYCGRSAPDVILHVDHIEPKSKGGEDDIINLVTSCVDCNLGKSDRVLSDDAVIKRRKEQLDELQQKREQLKMMMDWHRSLIDLEERTVLELSDFWSELVSGFQLLDSGTELLKKWVKKFGFNEVVEAIKISTGQYLEYEDTKKGDGSASFTKNSVEKSFRYIPKICAVRKKEQEKPYLKDLYYIRGILRNRIWNWGKDREWRSIDLMEVAISEGVTIDTLKDIAKNANEWTSFVKDVVNLFP